MTNLERAESGFQWRINLTAISAGMSAIAAFTPPTGATYALPTVFIAGSESSYIRDKPPRTDHGTVPQITDSDNQGREPLGSRRPAGSVSEDGQSLSGSD